MSTIEVGLVVAVGLLTVVTTILAHTLAATARRLTLLERRLRREELRDAARAAGVAGGSTGDAVDIRGADPDGRPVVVPLERADRPTMLVFLSTSCGTCLGIWEKLRGEGLGAARGVSPVVVTKDADEESLPRIRELLDAGPPVVLSSEAWDDYEVPGSPYGLLISAAPGSVVAEGTPARWEDVVRMASTGSPAGDQRR